MFYDLIWFILENVPFILEKKKSSGVGLNIQHIQPKRHFRSFWSSVISSPLFPYWFSFWIFYLLLNKHFHSKMVKKWVWKNYLKWSWYVVNTGTCMRAPDVRSWRHFGVVISMSGCWWSDAISTYDSKSLNKPKLLGNCNSERQRNVVSILCTDSGIRLSGFKYCLSPLLVVTSTATVIIICINNIKKTKRKKVTYSHHVTGRKLSLS